MQRVSDYFLVVGLGGKLRPFDKAQETAPPLRRVYKGKVLDRFPRVDYPDVPFPPGMALFCGPAGLTMNVLPPSPRVHYFVATQANGDRLYGVCLTVYEPATPALLRAIREREAVRERRRSMSMVGGLARSESGRSERRPLDPAVAGWDDEDTEFSATEHKAAAAAAAAATAAAAAAAAAASTEASGAAHAPHADAAAASATEQLYAPKCLCVLLRHPFLRETRAFLAALYRMSLTPSRVPLERVVCNFLLEVPLPPRGRVRVEYSIGSALIQFARAPRNDPLRFPTFPIRTLFHYLSIANIETALVAVLLERRVLLLSTELSLLTMAAEVLTALIFPFSWRHVYIPLLPRSLIDFVHAPLPFIIGAHSAAVRVEELSPEVVVVELDSNRVTCGQPLPPLPEHERKKLLAALQPLAKLYLGPPDSPLRVAHNNDLAFQQAPTPEQIDSAIGEAQVALDEREMAHAFFKIFVSIFKNYRDFLIFPSREVPEPASGFDERRFLQSVPQRDRDFFAVLFNTQAWQHFVERRTLPNASEPDVLFFDEAIVSKKNRSTFALHRQTPFLDDRSEEIVKTFVVPSPDVSGLPPDKTFYSPTFPVLDEALFAPARLANPLGTEGYARATSSRAALAPQPPEAVLFASWLTLFAATVRSRAQSPYLELAFDVLRRMAAEGLVPDESSCRLLVDACGACGQPQVAVRVLQVLQSAGRKPSASLFSTLLQAFFANNDTAAGYHALAELRKPPPAKRLDNFLDEVRRNLQLPRAQRPRQAALAPLEARLALFEAAVPGRTIETSDSCPECGKHLSEAAVRAGWRRENNDYTTRCDAEGCAERFVARLVIKGGGDPPLIVEHLPMDALRKELATLADNRGGDFFCGPDFRLHSPAVYWNCVWHFAGAGLPLQFLLHPRAHAGSEGRGGEEEEEGDERPSVASTIDEESSDVDDEDNSAPRALAAALMTSPTDPVPPSARPSGPSSPRGEDGKED